MDFDELFKKYKLLNYVPSIEEEKEKIYEYVYFTNKLEGNRLTLAQTTSLLEKNKISGTDLGIYDILETKGVFNSVNHMLSAIIQKRELSIDLMIELNWQILGSIWKDDFGFVSAKQAGQQTGQFKTIRNRIRIIKSNGEKSYITPLSEPENVKQNMIVLVENINSSKKDVLYKAAFLAQEIWLHQPFVDGNKRTGRLLINFLTMKEGLPLFSFEDKAKNYNHLLVEQYTEGKKDLIKNYLQARLVQEMDQRIKIIEESNQNKDKGFRIIL
jgi:Fic family protein